MEYTDEEYERDMILGYLDESEINSWSPKQALMIAEARNREAAHEFELTALGG